MSIKKLATGGIAVLAAALIVVASQAGQPVQPVSAQTPRGCGAPFDPQIGAYPRCVVIEKDADEDQDQEFPFVLEVSGDSDRHFELQDEEQYGLNVTELDEGDVITIDEIVPDDWAVDEYNCTWSGFDFLEQGGTYATFGFTNNGEPSSYLYCRFVNIVEEDPDEEDENGNSDESDNEERPRGNPGGIFGGVNTAQQNRERAGIIYPTPQPAPAPVVRPPSTGDAGLLP